jgi:hypothetical protein
MSSGNQQQELPDQTLTFRTIMDCRNYAIAYSLEHGFAFGTNDSSYTKGYLKMVCRHHGEYRSAKGKTIKDDDTIDLISLDTDTMETESTKDITTQDDTITKKKRNGKTSRSKCPVYIYFNHSAKRPNNGSNIDEFDDESNKSFRITSFYLKHNHAMASSPMTYHLHRKINTEQQMHLKSLVSSKASPRAVVRYMNSQHGTRISARDVNNWRYRFNNLENNECNNMEQFITYLECNNYEVRWTVGENKEITAFFFAHQTCIEYARRFNEVVLVDATYKTTRAKNYFVNMVGVSNVGRDDKTLSTFAVAGAWVSREDEKSALWVMEQLANTVYCDQKRLPGIFVTDQQQSMINAISSVFPGSKQMLCYIHLAKNFQANTGKTFLTADNYRTAEMLFKKFGSCVNKTGYESAFSTLVTYSEKHTSDKGNAVKQYLKR